MSTDFTTAASSKKFKKKHLLIKFMKANTVNGRELLQAVMSEPDKIYYIMIQNYISIANRIQS